MITNKDILSTTARSDNFQFTYKPIYNLGRLQKALSALFDPAITKTFHDVPKGATNPPEAASTDGQPIDTQRSSMGNVIYSRFTMDWDA
jgi:hypothetical protein